MLVVLSLVSWAWRQGVEQLDYLSFACMHLSHKKTKKLFYHVCYFLSAQTCTDDDCIIYTNCVSCAFQIVNNGLQQGDIASCRECDGIQVVQVGNRGEIVEPVRACTAALSCNVDYYFALDQTDRVIYVVTTLQST